MINSDELYNKLVCALTHRIEICSDCRKCARKETDDAADIRMNIIEDLAEYMGKELPWVEE